MIARLPQSDDPSRSASDEDLARLHRLLVALSVGGMLLVIGIQVGSALEWPYEIRWVIELGATASLLTATGLLIFRVKAIPRFASWAVGAGMLSLALGSITRIVEQGLKQWKPDSRTVVDALHEAHIYLDTAAAGILLCVINLGMFQIYASRTKLLRQREREKRIVEKELQEVSEKLVRQTRLATIGHISENIAHDLRNPLGAIQIACVYLERHVPTQDKKWREYLELISREIKNADAIITNLTQVGEGRGPSKSKVGLRLLLQKASAAARGRDGTSASTTRCDLDGDLDLIVGDAAQLKQVFANLISNAIESTSDSRQPDGEDVVTIHGRRDGDVDEILVSDAGPGVPWELRKRIFEPLYTSKPERIGLGLSIAKHIVEMHGGTIDVVDPETSHGTTVRVRLPRA